MAETAKNRRSPESPDAATLHPERHSRTDPRVVSDFISLLREIVPLLEGVKVSIEESSGRIPKAAQQLSKVTQATESATVDILNALEAMSTRIVDAEKELGTVTRYVENVKLSVGSMLSGPGAPANDSASGGAHPALTEMLHDYIRKSDIENTVARIRAILADTRTDTMNITMALQVQDITSQQIAGVSQTIESVRKQLIRTLERFERGDTAPEQEASEKGAPAFDGEAQYGAATARQDLADEIVRQWNTNGS